LIDAAAYDPINGNAVDESAGPGTFGAEKRDNGGALVTFPAGEGSFWVEENPLTYRSRTGPDDVDETYQT
jgi:hypothetical protein